VLIMFDWRRMQDHWAFWHTLAFVPVITTIQEVFVLGQPLVRHYKLGSGPGMSRQERQRVIVWDAAADGGGVEGG
jgi:hypothetical protein